jgi:hypothetical protein
MLRHVPKRPPVDRWHTDDDNDNEKHEGLFNQPKK